MYFEQPIICLRKEQPALVCYTSKGAIERWAMRLATTALGADGLYSWFLPLVGAFPCRSGRGRCRRQGRKLMTNLMLVVAGGAIGAGSRYLLSGWVQAQISAGFPWGTFAVNILGSLVMGPVIGLVERGGLSSGTGLFLTVGVLGGFTTFSAFSHETLRLMETGQAMTSLLERLRASHRRPQRGISKVPVQSFSCLVGHDPSIPGCAKVLWQGADLPYLAAVEVTQFGSTRCGGLDPLPG